MNILRALAVHWKEEADALEQRYSDERAARMFRLHAAELEEAIRRTEDDTLTLTDAARESGYSADHLRHLVSEDKIRNAGTKGRPRIRRGDLPIKPGARATAKRDEATQQAHEILQSVRAGRREGGQLSLQRRTIPPAPSGPESASR